LSAASSEASAAASPAGSAAVDYSVGVSPAFGFPYIF